MVPPRIVIIGAGFGGLSAAKGLGRAPADITVIDRSNHHLFQPLLYQVATATLSPADIASPIRNILRHQKNTEVMLGSVERIDTSAKKIHVDGHEVSYDYLIVATGASHGYFGHGEWEKFAAGLKTISDALKIRQRILMAFERAEMESADSTRKAYLTFVLVGGGPTGVEMAGAISELARRALAKDFRHINPQETNVILIEAGPRVLAQFPESLSHKAKRSLERLGVEVRTDSRVEEVSERGVLVGGKWIESKTVMWAAGVVPSPAAKWLKAETDRLGRVIVGPDLSLRKHPEIFVIGDTASVATENGKILPGVAPVAMQEGRYVAELLKRRLEGQNEFPPFKYRDKGNLATIGRSAAVAQIGRWKLSGAIAWITWLVVHIMYLIGFRNRLVVLTEWAWSYITFQRGARLITSTEPTIPSSWDRTDGE